MFKRLSISWLAIAMIIASTFLVFNKSLAGLTDTNPPAPNLGPTGPVIPPFDPRLPPPNPCATDVVHGPDQVLPDSDFRLCQSVEAVTDLVRNEDGSYSWCCLDDSQQFSGKNCGCRSRVNPAAIDGKCGSAEGRKFFRAPTDNLCDRGSATTVRESANGEFTWDCLGQNNGQPAHCAAYKSAKANCGWIIQLMRQLTPDDPHLCNPGAVSNFSSSGPRPERPTNWTWDCLGEDPNSTEDDDLGCSTESVVYSGTCGRAVLERQKPTENFCSYSNFGGFTVEDDDGGFWQWLCLGSGHSESTDITCEARRDTQPSSNNTKDASKYAFKKSDYNTNTPTDEDVSRQIFLVKANNWQEVMSLVPLTTWTNSNGELTKYPTFIYLVDEYNGESTADLDSVIHTAQMYGADHATVVGNTLTQVTDLLYAPRPTGAQLPQANIVNLNYWQNPELYFAYWSNYDDVVYSADSYQFAQLGATYASLINAPLVVSGSSLDVDAYVGGKRLICFGQNNQRSCDVTYTDFAEMQTAYADKVYEITKTRVNKLIVTNANDLGFSLRLDLKGADGGDAPFYTKKTGQLYHLLGKQSLAAPFLASAKYEVILPFSKPISSYDCNKSEVDCYGIHDEVAAAAARLGFSREDNGPEKAYYTSLLKTKLTGPETTINRDVIQAFALGDKLIYNADGTLKSYDLVTGQDTFLRNKQPRFNDLVVDNDKAYWFKPNAIYEPSQYEVYVLNPNTGQSDLLTTFEKDYSNYSLSEYSHEFKVNNGDVLFAGADTIKMTDGQKKINQIKYYDSATEQVRTIFSAQENDPYKMVENSLLAGNKILWRQYTMRGYDSNQLYVYDLSSGQTSLVANLPYNTNGYLQPQVQANDSYAAWLSDDDQTLNYYNLASGESSQLANNGKITQLIVDNRGIFFKAVNSQAAVEFRQLNTDTNESELMFTETPDNYCPPYTKDQQQYLQRFIFEGDYLYFYCAGPQTAPKYQNIFGFNLITKQDPVKLVDTDRTSKTDLAVNEDKFVWIEQILQPTFSVGGYLTIIGDAYAVPFISYYSENIAADKGVYANTEGLFFSFYSPIELPAGRLTGYTVSDLSSLVARSIFYDDFNYARGVAMYTSEFNGSNTGLNFLEKACPVFSGAGYEIKDCSKEYDLNKYIEKFEDCSRLCLCNNDPTFKAPYEASKKSDGSLATPCAQLSCRTAAPYCDQETKTRIANSDFRAKNWESKYIDIALLMMEKEGRHWSDAGFIAYIDHGNDNYSGIYEGNVPELNNPLVVGMGCDTARIYTNYTALPTSSDGSIRRRSIALTALRQGAIAFLGSATPYYEWYTGYGLANDTYYSGQALGYSFVRRTKLTDSSLLLGDPTLPVSRGARLNEPIY